MSTARYMIQLVSPGGEILTKKLRTKLGDYEGLATELALEDWAEFGAMLTDKSGGLDKEHADYCTKYAAMFDYPTFEIPAIPIEEGADELIDKMVERLGMNKIEYIDEDVEELE
jgi:hypothetical protein